MFSLQLSQDPSVCSTQCPINGEVFHYGSWEQALFPALGEYGVLSPAILSDGPIPRLGQFHPTHVLTSLVLNS